MYLLCAHWNGTPGGALGPGFLTLPLFYFKTKDLILTFLLQFKMSTFYRCFLLDFFTGTTFHVRVCLVTLNIRG